MLGADLSVRFFFFFSEVHDLGIRCQCQVEFPQILILI